MIRVTVWNENLHEKNDPEVTRLYPGGIHGHLAGYLNTLEGIEARTATQDQPDCGLSDEVLQNTDVLLWWGQDVYKRQALEDAPEAGTVESAHSNEEAL